MWMSWNWFYIADGEKVTQSSAVDNLIRLMIIQSKDFTRKVIRKVGRYMQTSFSLILTSQVKARSSIVGN